MRAACSCLVIASLVGLSRGEGQAQSDDIDTLQRQVLKLVREKKHKEALPLAGQLVAIAEKKWGPDHPAVAAWLGLLASLNERLGRNAKAEPLYLRSLSISNKVLGNSQGALRKASQTFPQLRQNPGLGRAEAFRLAMVRLMREPKQPWAAHPLVWAPFVVVGEGGAGRR